MMLHTLGEQSVTVPDLVAINQFFHNTMFNATQLNLENRINTAAEKFQKIVAGDRNERVLDAYTYADVKRIIEKILNSPKLMKELAIIPFGFGMPFPG